MDKPLTVAQAAQVLGMSERTLRRRVASGQIDAVKGTTPETGAAWFIEAATIDALSRPAPRQEEQKEVEPAGNPAPIEPEPPAEVVQLRGEVREIKAFLVGQASAENSEQHGAGLGTVIAGAIRKGMAPMMERIEQQSAENALLKQQVDQAQNLVSQAEAREREAAAWHQSKSWWPFPPRR